MLPKSEVEERVQGGKRLAKVSVERETKEGEVRKVPCSFRGWRSGNNTTLLR